MRVLLALLLLTPAALPAGTADGACTLGTPSSVEWGPQGTRLQTRPLVYADFHGVDAACAGAVSMRLDGEAVEPIVRDRGFRLEVVYVPPDDLLPGPHDVEVLVADASGSGDGLSLSWSFRVLVPAPHEPVHEASPPSWLLQGLVVGPVAVVSVTSWEYDVWLDPFAPLLHPQGTGYTPDVLHASVGVGQQAAVFLAGMPVVATPVVGVHREAHVVLS